MVGSCHTTEMMIATRAEPATKSCVDVLEVWPESHWPGFALRQTDVL